MDDELDGLIRHIKATWPLRMAFEAMEALPRDLYEQHGDNEQVIEHIDGRLRARLYGIVLGEGYMPIKLGSVRWVQDAEFHVRRVVDAVAIPNFGRFGSRRPAL